MKIFYLILFVATFFEVGGRVLEAQANGGIGEDKSTLSRSELESVKLHSDRPLTQLFSEDIHLSPPAQISSGYRYSNGALVAELFPVLSVKKSKKVWVTGPKESKTFNPDHDGAGKPTPGTGYMKCRNFKYQNHISDDYKCKTNSRGNAFLNYRELVKRYPRGSSSAAIKNANDQRKANKSAKPFSSIDIPNGYIDFAKFKSKFKSKEEFFPTGSQCKLKFYDQKISNKVEKYKGKYEGQLDRIHKVERLYHVPPKDGSKPYVLLKFRGSDRSTSFWWSCPTHQKDSDAFFNGTVLPLEMSNAMSIDRGSPAQNVNNREDTQKRPVNSRSGN